MPSDFNGSFVSITIQDMAHRDLETRTNWIFCTTCLFSWKEPFSIQKTILHKTHQSFFTISENLLSYFTRTLTDPLLCTVKEQEGGKKEEKTPKSLGNIYSFTKKKKWEANNFETILVKTVENTEGTSKEKVESFFEGREKSSLRIWCCCCYKLSPCIFISSVKT